MKKFKLLALSLALAGLALPTGLEASNLRKKQHRPGSPRVANETKESESMTVEQVELEEPVLAPISRQEEPAEEQVYKMVEELPSFPGGESALMTWVANNINYPISAEENGISGRVIVGFVIEKNGSISNVQIVKGVDKDLDTEAMRVVKKMPKWNPGRHNGVPVRVFFNLPVTFKLVKGNTDSTPESGDGVTVKSVVNQ